MYVNEMSCNSMCGRSLQHDAIDRDITEDRLLR